MYRRTMNARIYASSVQSTSEFEALKDITVFKVSTGEPKPMSEIISEYSTRGRCIMPLATHYGDLSSFELCQKLNFNLPELKSKGIFLKRSLHLVLA